MWQSTLLNALSKFALPIAGAALALILTLSVALRCTNSRLDTARADLADSRAEVLTCMRANATQSATIVALEATQERNRAQRDAALARQREAIKRIEEMEQDRGDEITEVEQAESDCLDACMLPDPVRLLLDPRRDRDADG